MAVTGVHLLFHSPEADALRAVLRDVFDGPSVEAGPGWPIFAVPPAELAVHPGSEAHHEISLMCDDLDATIAELRAKGVTFRGRPEERRFGRAITMALPGGIDVLLYQPAHPTAIGRAG
jgi:catechol 2,3-dioxygenase-like lactoylglutathione lyase family enzyme